MRVLIDECVDVRLAKAIDGFTVRTVSDMGWVGIKNGDLLSRAALEFNAPVTVDRNLPFQQQLAKYSLAVILLESPTNRLADLLKLVPKLVAALPSAAHGMVTRVGL